MKWILCLLAIPAIAYANTHSGNGYDVVPRVVNFFLFAGICYYLLANPIKKLYKDRIKGVADELESIQSKLIKSKKKRQELTQKLDAAKIEASNIIKISKEEANLLVKKIEIQLSHELDTLEKTQLSKQKYEVKRIKKELSTKVLNQLFADKSFELSHQHVLDIVFKKVV